MNNVMLMVTAFEYYGGTRPDKFQLGFTVSDGIRSYDGARAHKNMREEASELQANLPAAIRLEVSRMLPDDTLVMEKFVVIRNAKIYVRAVGLERHLNPVAAAGSGGGGAGPSVQETEAAGPARAENEEALPVHAPARNVPMMPDVADELSRMQM